MTFEAYLQQYQNNMKIMSRTANGVVDTTASTTKNDVMLVSDGNQAKKLAFSNTETALRYAFDHRRDVFASREELAAFLLKLAAITNAGVVKADALFRSGADSQKFPYAPIRDLEVIWDWFLEKLFWALNNPCFEVAEMAGFCEFMINMGAHFFADGCGKISMLVSTWVFMREDLPAVQYRSRNDYYQVLANHTPIHRENLKTFLMDPTFLNFIRYYKSLCIQSKESMHIYLKTEETGDRVIFLEGMVRKDNLAGFENRMDELLESVSEQRCMLDCDRLLSLCADACRYFDKLQKSGWELSFRNLNYDCQIALMICGVDAGKENQPNLPEIDVTGCPVIGEGANGIIYRINDELIVKAFKRTPDYDDLNRERMAMRNALISGVPAPFSFGCAKTDGRIAMLMELIRSGSLMDVFRETEAPNTESLKEYVELVKGLHIEHEGQNLNLFPDKGFEKEVYAKAERIDHLLAPKYRGKIRQILDSIDAPTTLIHGDIQPNNVLMTGGKLIFIDFDTFSTGRPEFDLASLYRTLLCSQTEEEPKMNLFLKCSTQTCQTIWDSFFMEYYGQETEEVREEKKKIIKVIAYTLWLAFSEKRFPDSEQTQQALNWLEESIEECMK